MILLDCQNSIPTTSQFFILGCPIWYKWPSTLPWFKLEGPSAFILKDLTHFLWMIQLSNNDSDSLTNVESKCSVSQLKSQGIKRTIKSQFALIISLIASVSAFLYFTASMTFTFKIYVQNRRSKEDACGRVPRRSWSLQKSMVICTELNDYSFFKTVLFYPSTSSCQIPPTLTQNVHFLLDPKLK